MVKPAGSGEAHISLDYIEKAVKINKTQREIILEVAQSIFVQEVVKSESYTSVYQAEHLSSWALDMGRAFVEVLTEKGIIVDNQMRLIND